MYAKTIALVAAVAIASSLAACGEDSGSEGKSGTDPLSRAKSATVTVLNHAGDHTYQSSGVVYDTTRGLVVTSATAVWDRDSVDVVTGQGRELKARLVARSPCGDIAVVLLDPKPPGLTAIKVGSSKRLAPGQRVTALGYVSGEGSHYETSQTGGTASASDASVALDETLPKHSSLVEHQAPLAATLAGGPLVNSRGDLVGINTVLNTYGHAPDAPAGLSFAASSDYVKSRLNELTPTTTAFYEGWESEHECHDQFQKLVRKHRGATKSESSQGMDDSNMDSQSKDDKSMKKDDSSHMDK